ncbi:MAG: hypothetical protein ACFB0B_12025 [Thermonemataceae bacterium]
MQRNASIIFLSFYFMVTLYARLYFEPRLSVNYLQSMLIGVCLLAIPYLMYRLKLLNFTHK